MTEDAADRVGRFITIEGSEGAGKSSNIETICATLEAAAIPYFATREPGGTPLAEEIRELLLTPRDEVVTPMSELLLMFAARAQHVAEVITPNLQAGRWVVCDRFTDATFAYQGYGRGMSLEVIEGLENWVQGSLRPDLTLFLDLPPEIGAQRIANREKDRLEAEEMIFFEKVRAGYAARAASNPNMRVIDASLPLQSVQDAVAKAVQSLLPASTASVR